jgi:cytochrome c553
MERHRHDRRVVQPDEIKRGTRSHPAISAAAEELSDAATEALGVYFGKLEP